MGEHSKWVRAVLLVALGACHSARSSTTTTTSSRSVSTDETLVRMAKARCEREMLCDHVGRGQVFSDPGACERDLRARANAELLARECPRGIREGHLEDCLSEVRHEACGNPLHTAERIDMCAARMLCVDD
jgi:hypothetical protein